MTYRTSVISLVALAALLGGCGGSSPSRSTVAHLGSTTTPTTASSTGGQIGGGIANHFQQLVRFSQCMRTHGEPSFPDPQQHDHGISLSVNGLNPKSAQFQAAQKACASLAPAGIAAGSSPAQLRVKLDAFAACMRSHGEPNFPDPKVTTSSGSGGRGEVAVRIGGHGVDPRSPQFQKAQQDCRSLLPGGGP